MELRYYQQAAIDATYNYLNSQKGNPCIVIPTGGGKTAVMATMCKDVSGRWGGRTLVISHVKELIEQTAGTLRKLFPELPVGIYSAGLNSRDTTQPVLVAGIQSVYNKAEQLGRFDMILVDESHLIPPDGDGMYQTFLQDAQKINPRLRLVGLTATPYRLKSGMICAPENLLNHISYEVGVRELINGGFLSSITSRAGSRKVDCSALHIIRGEFDAQEVDELVNTAYLLNAVVEDIKDKATERKSILVFCNSIASAENFCKIYNSVTGDTAGLITGKTSSVERENLISRFKGETIRETLFDDVVKEPLRTLVNVNVLTTGFDAPNVDCVVMLRPTTSSGLYYQQIGRGFRLSPKTGKKDCLILDYVGNILRHGPVDVIAPKGKSKEGSRLWRQPCKECPKCGLIIHFGFTTCPECGYEFSSAESNNGQYTSQASDEGVLSGEITDKVYDVQKVYYSIHVKHGAQDSDPRTIRVDYYTSIMITNTEWICPEHEGYARQKFVAWWQKRVAPEFQPPNWEAPKTVEDFMEFAEGGAIAAPSEITVRKMSWNKYPRIIDYKLKEIPTYSQVEQNYKQNREPNNAGGYY